MTPSRSQPDGSSDKSLGIGEEFAVPSIDDWAAAFDPGASAAEPILDLWEKLSRVNDDGLKIRPLYTPDSPGTERFSAGLSAAPWLVAQEMPIGEPGATNAQIHQALRRGATAVHLTAASPAEILSLTEARLSSVLADVDLSIVPLFIQSRSTALPCLAVLAATAKRKSVGLESLAGAIAGDPIGELLRSGSLDSSVDSALDQLAAATRFASMNAPQMGTIWIHGELWSDAGASTVDQLAASMATAIAYLRALEDRGIDPEMAAAHFRFSFGLDQRLFAGTAQLRAARQVWDRVLELCEVPAEKRPMFIHARPSTYTMTIYDPHVNMLRSSLSACAAAIGGADSVHVSQFDESSGPGSEFSRRIARNAQLVLAEEAHLAKVGDSAAGSWYIESLTAATAEKAWETVREIDAAEGCLDSLVSGAIRQHLKSLPQSGKPGEPFTSGRPLVGVTHYPNPADSAPGVAPAQASDIDLDTTGPKAEDALAELRKATGEQSQDLMTPAIQAAATGASVGNMADALRRDNDTAPSVAPLLSCRRAEPIEKLRQAVTEFREQGNKTEVSVIPAGDSRNDLIHARKVAVWYQAAGFAAESTTGTPKDVEAVCVVCGGSKTDATVLARAVRKTRKRSNTALLVVIANKESAQAVGAEPDEYDIGLLFTDEIGPMTILSQTAEKLGVAL
jgi:methylmalonyl-CoA mutase